MNPTPLTNENAAALAKKWQVSTRTIFNWKRRGVALEHDIAVVDFIIGLKNPTTRQLAAAADVLAEKLPDGDGFAAGVRRGLSATE